jgi:hypothetical protein
MESQSNRIKPPWPNQLIEKMDELGKWYSHEVSRIAASVDTEAEFDTLLARQLDQFLWLPEGNTADLPEGLNRAAALLAVSSSRYSMSDPAFADAVRLLCRAARRVLAHDLRAAWEIQQAIRGDFR